MEKTDRETRDFMNVESFSQLPFIRPVPAPALPKEKTGIRLFGKEFGAGTGDAEESESETIEAEEIIKENSNTTNINSRKFECHYCCRNFPTSQALGGHQNAHKRERQHAKRVHLQSAMVHGAAAEANNIYGIMNYRIPNYHHPSTWLTNSTSRFYGSPYNSSHHHQTPPINGSPLALWRIPAPPTYNNSSNYGRPVVFTANNHQDFKSSPIINTTSSSQDHVSLDLHL